MLLIPVPFDEVVRSTPVIVPLLCMAMTEYLRWLKQLRRLERQANPEQNLPENWSKLSNFRKS